jgi:hypothetical protein
MHRLESIGFDKTRDRKVEKSTVSGKHKSRDLDLFVELEKAIGDNFDSKDLKKFTGENPAEWLIYKRICVSRISAKACMDVIIPTEDRNESSFQYQQQQMQQQQMRQNQVYQSSPHFGEPISSTTYGTNSRGGGHFKSLVDDPQNLTNNVPARSVIGRPHFTSQSSNVAAANGNDDMSTNGIPDDVRELITDFPVSLVIGSDPRLRQ